MRRRAGSSAVVRWIVIGLAVTYVLAFVVRLRARKYDIFFPDYVRWLITPVPPQTSPKQVFFVFVDHFEPDYDLNRVLAWSRRYRALAARHRDSTGRPPQHTFFYPGEQPDAQIYRALRELTRGGLGEVELHYHHDFDTADTLEPKLVSAIANLQQYGFLKTIDGQTRFAFIHGNWGLDNSDGPANCGVNNELGLLHRLGNFADFTFPSVYSDAQPPFVNTIYAAKDDDGPKSYKRALPLAELNHGADLMIFQGPLIFAPSLSIKHLFFDLDDGNIHAAVPATPRRVDRWIHADVHVAARPDWLFVKVFAHGISTRADADAVLGADFDRTLSYLEHEYNDGVRYRLRYVTAREAYNVAHAAAIGARGEPDRYLNQPIAPYLADANGIDAAPPAGESAAMPPSAASGQRISLSSPMTNTVP